MDIFFWPVVDLFMWGFLTLYMLKISHAVPTLITCLISASILWRILFCAQNSVTIAFLEDVWSRNLINIFVAPIKTVEYISAAYFSGCVQAVAITIILGILAAAAYSFNLLNLGLGFIFLFVNLLFVGWSLGLFSVGLILRLGPSAEVLAWAIPFLLQPVSAVFYPVSALPKWLQLVALCVPSAHVFEGMREILSTSHLAPYHIWCAFLLNLVFMVLSSVAFHLFLQSARRRGLLAKYYQ
jgi:ABC-2 type transport system permease protein